MYDTHQILKILASKKEELKKNYPISDLALLGSYARGDHDENSDIDILVNFAQRIDGFDYIRIAHELEDCFEQKIDLVSRKGIKPEYLSFVEENIIYV